ncbi:MAG: SDR family oxidoreductase, partial [Acidobacteriaceae bacterium]|nr:SDR family oxidoreductase [Acidobacteriaceae bacterium]
MTLNGKVALVTGGATGIGLGISEALARSGAKVAIAQRRISHIETAKDNLREFEVFGVKADISSRTSVEQLIGDVLAHFGELHILVNNASVTGNPALCPFLDAAEEHLDQIIDTNLKGTFYVSQLAARHMVQHGTPGSIIHVSSVAAFASQEFASVYCASKAAQVSLAKSMALELAPYGIRVNAIAPGDIYTSQNATVGDDLKEQGGSGRYIRYT